MTHDPMCPMPTSKFMAATCRCDLIARVRADEREKADCPDPSICDRHDCAAAAAYCDGVADERERAAERVAAVAPITHLLGERLPLAAPKTIKVADAVAAARGGDRGTGGVSVPRCGVCKQELVWMGVELDGNTTRLHHRDDLSPLCAAGGS